MEKFFKISKVKDGIPCGWRLATYKEVNDSMQVVIDLLDQWTIAKLQDGWQVSGGGYGNKVEKYDDPNKTFGDQLITNAINMIKKEFKVTKVKDGIPCGWRLATYMEANDSTVKDLLDEWTIAKLEDGWQVAGGGYGNKVERYADPNKSFGDQVITNSIKKEFRVTRVKDGMPSGWRLATHWEAEDSMQDVTDLLDEWTIAKLEDGWQVVGGGYGNKVEKYDDPNRQFGDQLITVVRPVKDVRVVEIAEGITRDWSWATKSQVESVKEDVEKLLGEWSIAKLLDGWKIDGGGYGYKITKCDSDDGTIKEMVIVQESL
ncbi:uncharacterized protein LOC121420009 [Lytechinus variegatus]|uniref:uncharacterized protein LOC121420009 n=1 Tax=Lytechinus variegatus TaxID=7654 RepID=UPI001BB2CC1B|nr:uncharacterized protein LOC121420009 [Lytechinus variegatus]